jgi:hypothetical protein
VNELTRSLGLPNTVLATDVRGIFEILARDAGFSGWREFASQTWENQSDVERVVELMKVATVSDPAQANATRTTAHETAVFTRAHALYTRPMDIDDAIGEASRIAIEALRDGR